MIKKAVIMSGGKAPCNEVLIDEINNADLVIGADSGANTLYKYNIKPDILLGDFDSISKTVLNYYSGSQCNIEIYPPEKDYTDTELALVKAMELGCKEICFLGCTGSRIDHLLGNLGLLKICLDNDIKAYIRDDNNLIFIVKTSCKLAGNKGQVISFQAYGDAVKNFSIKGAKYELNDYILTIGDPRTVSNEFMEEDIYISFSKGYVMIIYSKD